MHVWTGGIVQARTATSRKDELPLQLTIFWGNAAVNHLFATMLQFIHCLRHALSTLGGGVWFAALFGSH
jgi:hypothetical protein